MTSGRRIQIEFLGNNRDLDRAMDTSATRSAKFGDALKKAGKVAAVGLAVGAGIAAKALFDMTKGAIEDAAAQERLATALKNNAGATKGQVSAIEDWISAQGTALGVADDELRPALEKLVVATKDVGEAQKLTKLAMDISAGSGKSLEQVTTALAKAQNGSISGLTRLGISTKNAAGETITFEQAQKRLGDAFEGQAAKKANTLEGKIGRLKLILAETGETIGSKMIPVVTKMADWFLRVGLPALEKFGGYLQDTLPPIFEKIRAVISKVLGGMKGDVGGNLQAVKDIVRDAVSIIQSLWKRFGGIITDYVVNTFKNIKQVIKGALQVVRGIFKTVSSLLKGDWKGAWDGIKMILKGAWDVIKGVVKQSLNILKTLMKIGWSAIKGVVGAAWDGIKQLAANGLDKVIDAVKSIPGKIKALASNYRDVGKFLIDALINGLSKAGSFVSDIAGNVWNAVKGMLNAAIDKINSALEFKISLPGPDVNINPPNIPHLARGTNFHRGGLALVGEEGPELVNLPRGSRVTPHGKSMGALRGLGGGGVQIIINTLDPKAAGRAVVEALRQVEKDTGRRLLVSPS